MEVIIKTFTSNTDCEDCGMYSSDIIGYDEPFGSYESGEVSSCFSGYDGERRAVIVSLINDLRNSGVEIDFPVWNLPEPDYGIVEEFRAINKKMTWSQLSEREMEVMRLHGDNHNWEGIEYSNFFEGYTDATVLKKYFEDAGITLIEEYEYEDLPEYETNWDDDSWDDE